MKCKFKYKIGDRVLYGSYLGIISMIGVRELDSMPMYVLERSSDWVSEDRLRQS